MSQYFIYYIGHNPVKPVVQELINLIQPGNLLNIGIKITVDTKLPEPYNSCKEDINSKTSHLVKMVLEQNITYRKVNCYESCLENYALKHNLSMRKFFFNDKEFSYINECSQFCPLECTSKTFDVIKNELSLDNQFPYDLKVNFYFINPKYTEITQTVKISVPDLIANTGGLLGLFLELSFFSAYRFINYILDLIISRFL